MGNDTILEVEANENDILMLQLAFEEVQITNPVQAVRDGRHAIAYLEGSGDYADRHNYPFPCLVLLDLELPGVPGLAVLKWLRQQSGLPWIPVLVLSSAAQKEEVLQSYTYGANSYIVKPSTLHDRLQFARAVKEYWLHFHQLPAEYYSSSGKATPEILF